MSEVREPRGRLLLLLLLLLLLPLLRMISDTHPSARSGHLRA
jgi:hypothetical protein